jgi:PAS domain-containing protein
LEKRLSITKNFTAALAIGLRQKFGKIPSSTEFANQFNLRAYGTRAIARETARKWKSGLAFPEAGHLQVLIEWLNLDTAGIFSPPHSPETPVTQFSQTYSTLAFVNAARALQKSELLAQAALNALSPRTVILNENGTIILVNNAWRSYAASNPGLNYSKSCCEGVNYLKICDNARGLGAEFAVQMGVGIRAVIRGERAEYALKYPCYSLSEKQWFIGKAIRFASKGDACTVVSHEAITERRFAEESL